MNRLIVLLMAVLFSIPAVSRESSIPDRYEELYRTVRDTQDMAKIRSILENRKTGRRVVLYINKNPSAILRAAINTDRADIVGYLLSRGINVNHRDANYTHGTNSTLRLPSTACYPSRRTS